jgi:pimeloyl-ACP methyl ester carboxylesterase
MSALPEAPPGRTVAAGRSTLYVREAGPAGAPTAVFVHGLGGSSTNWTDLVHLLGDDLRCAVPDLPGHGRSPASWSGRYDLDAHCDAIRDLVAELGEEPVHLVGNSTGGAIAVRLAAEFPQLVRTLTLVSPALPQFRISRGSDPRLAALLVPGLGDVAMRVLARQPPEVRVRRIMEVCFADPSGVAAERLAAAEEEMARRTALPWSSQAFLETLRGLVRSYLTRGLRSLGAQVAQVQAPTLLVHGEQDRLVPVAVARRYAPSIPDCRLVVLPDVGHVAMMERPEVVADLVRELVGRAAELEGPNRSRDPGQ